MSIYREDSSFRDRSGFVFYADGNVYRAVCNLYEDHVSYFFSSGLYKYLNDNSLLISHQELNNVEWPESESLGKYGVCKVFRVEKIPFISYPYEWCFQQLKDAALLTLHIQLKALEYGMSLKDASAFNVQFYNGKPVFIDLLSFDLYEEGKPWVAYRQFCTHFLAPLALMSKTHIELNRLLRLYIDGIPLSLTSSLLPFRTKLSPFFQLHLHYHARLEKRYEADEAANQRLKYNLSKSKLIALIQHLIYGIQSLKLSITKTEWSDYYQQFSYSDQSIQHKKRLVKEWASSIAPSITWDLGCNTGVFSELLKEVSQHIVAFDIDVLAIEKFYHNVRQNELRNIIPLVLNLSQPSPAVGWGNRERKSFVDRGPADLVLALAVIHHICIGNNVPLPNVAELFSRITSAVVIEFVPKEDSQAQRLLVTRKDIFDDYHQNGFEEAFAEYFEIIKKERILDTQRVLYLMKRK